MNKTITLATIALVAVIMGMSAFAPAWAPPGDPNGDEGPDVKVTLCHVPPGNPENAHTIIVNEEDVAEHIAHGDNLGSCTG